MLILSTLLAKSTARLLRLLGRRGSALPGLIVEKVSPQYLQKMLAQLPGGVIIVTGTNGKTTTTKLISEMLAAQHLRVISNPTGSNFVRGIIAALAEKATLTAKLPYDIAVFEQDEAWARQFIRRVRPRGVVILNVMRDQMDRFGEIDTTAKLLAETAEAAEEWVILNANDKRVATIAKRLEHQKVRWFGHEAALLPHFLSDDQHYNQAHASYYIAAEPDVSLQMLSPGQLTLLIKGEAKTLHTQLDGTHNAINLAAAVATVQAASPTAAVDDIVATAERVKPAFGRGERIIMPSGAELRLQLVKNPGGFTHSLRLLAEQSYQSIGIAINDAHADGRDVSWLWDVDFGAIPAVDSSRLICGGVRAYDMALRLKYDDRPSSAVTPNPRLFLREVTDTLTDPDQKAIIFCTYTAMLQLRKLLKKRLKNLRREGL